MFWCEHIYVAFSTIYVGYLTLRRKSAYLRRKKISCSLSRSFNMRTLSLPLNHATPFVAHTHRHRQTHLCATRTARAARIDAIRPPLPPKPTPEPAHPAPHPAAEAGAAWPAAFGTARLCRVTYLVGRSRAGPGGHRRSRAGIGGYVPAQYRTAISAALDTPAGRKPRRPSEEGKWVCNGFE